MKLFFSWEHRAGRFFPCAESEPDGLKVLVCLLTDDGGLGRSHAISWIDEGIARMDKILNGEATSFIWDREDWGSELKRDFVEMYSLYDDSYAQRIESSKFRAILVSWKEFLQSTPTAGVVKELIV